MLLVPHYTLNYIYDNKNNVWHTHARAHTRVRTKHTNTAKHVVILLVPKEEKVTQFVKISHNNLNNKIFIGYIQTYCNI